MSLGLFINGTAVENVFGAKGAHTAAATGWKSNGTDLNASLLALADGQAIGYNTGAESNGTDFKGIFGIAPTSLPIQGETFIAVPTQAGGESTSIMAFGANTSTWSVTGAESNASGSIPSGATKVGVTATYVQGSTQTSITNNIPNYTTLTGTTEGCTLHLSSSQSDPLNATYSLTIVFQNSAGSTISTTTCTFFMDTAAS